MPPPKIYHFHPLVAGPISEWPRHLARVREMGFDHIGSAPLFAPGEAGDVFLTADPESLHPALEFSGSADEGISRICETCAGYGLRLVLDVVGDRMAADAALCRREPGWFATQENGAESPDPRRARVPADTAELRFEGNGLAAWWIDRLTRLARAGVGGFRCLHPDRVPGEVWRSAIGAVRAHWPQTLFIAWTPGIDRAAVRRLAGLGFDRTASSVAWWDVRASWLIEEAEVLHLVAPPIASPEPSFAERLAARLDPQADIARAYRRALRLAAGTANGMLVPMGFEYATRRAFHPARADPNEFETARQEAGLDLSDAIREANHLADAVAAVCPDGDMRALTGPGDAVSALLRADAADVRVARRAVMVLANPSLSHPAPLPFPLDQAPPAAGAPFDQPERLNGSLELREPLAPGEVRALTYRRARPVRQPVRRTDAAIQGAAAPRIAIEAVSPSLEDGRFAAKRLTGESVVIGADIIMDGHEMLAAELLWRPADETDWRRERLELTVNDRWEGRFIPQRPGRHVFSIAAWWDEWGSFRHGLARKQEAGQDVSLDIQEGVALLRAIAEGAPEATRDALNRAAEQAQVVRLLSEETKAAVEAAGHRPFLTELSRPMPVDADRPQAEFASWYEMFPRSATADPARPGMLRDVIGEMPRIRDLGFDVLYFPPIHPIGHTNRKGRNNSLRAEQGDVGSPYAIGNEQGGHDALDPALGTREDFRAVVAAAHEHGLEIALDFAIQCSMDHPWIREHPGWFRFRPDGSVKYAENPPKKYEDIVNVDFYAAGAVPALWLALRDVVRFWVGEGVRIFRVDNPHTKPLPFWEWLIADIRASEPEVIFLAEAFTRPKMMYRLAKIGFTQSYTYFTWRNSKRDMTEYMTELTRPPVRDCFRPNFFVNTPDINPYFLQTSGRPGFLIRAALAALLSGSWGMYSGFEVCEAAPLPGREEYLDSEKYQVRVRDWEAPGNISGEIRMLNRLRRSHPALQTHLGVEFLPAFNDAVLLFTKRAPGERSAIMVAISFDPRVPQEADIEVPLWRWGLADDAALAVDDLMAGTQWTMRGKHQHIRLDPAVLPFLIWHLTPPGPA